MMNRLQAFWKIATVHRDPFHHKGLYDLKYIKCYLGHTHCSKWGHFISVQDLHNIFCRIAELITNYFILHDWGSICFIIDDFLEANFVGIDSILTKNLEARHIHIQARNHSFILTFSSFPFVLLSKVFHLVLFLRRSLLKIIFVSH